MSNGPSETTPLKTQLSVTNRLLPFQRLFVDPRFAWAKETLYGTTQGNRSAHQSNDRSRPDSGTGTDRSCLQFVERASGNQGGLDGIVRIQPEPRIHEAVGGGLAVHPSSGLSFRERDEIMRREMWGTYSVLRGKYGEQGSASLGAQKALARGLKEETATQVREINKLMLTNLNCSICSRS